MWHGTFSSWRIICARKRSFVAKLDSQVWKKRKGDIDERLQRNVHISYGHKNVTPSVYNKLCLHQMPKLCHITLFQLLTCAIDQDDHLRWSTWKITYVWSIWSVQYVMKYVCHARVHIRLWAVQFNKACTLSRWVSMAIVSAFTCSCQQIWERGD